MSNGLMRMKLVAFGLVFLAAGTVVEASVLSLRAVKKNDVAIAATNNLAVVGGDKIEAEISLNTWANDFPPVPPPPNNYPAGVRLFQVQMNSTGYISPDNGHLTPLGWCRPLTFTPCPPACPAAYPTCDPSPAVGCRCTAGHNPSLGSFITTTRADFLLFGLDPIRDINTTSISYTYFGLAPDAAVPYAGAAKYLATLIVTVSPNACGIFTVSFDPFGTFIGDAANPANTSLPTFQPLTLVVSNCARQLMSCDAPHCSIDARRHMNPKTGGRENYNLIDMTFSKTTAGMTAGDFEVTVLPVVEGDVIPAIQTVTQDGMNPNKTRLTFLPRIRESRWTCIRDIGSNKRCCLGSLPGDDDDNRISNLNDIFKALDNLLGTIPPLPITKCDTDRSQLCAPADLLMMGDLFTGADLFDPSLNQTLPTLTNNACPDMRIPP